MLKGPFIGLLLLLVSGCASGYRGACSCAALSMGVFTNAELEVVLVLPDAAAERAGLQVGDILLDVRLAQQAPGESGDPVLFSDVDAARELTSQGNFNGCCSGGTPVRLRVQRDEHTVEIYVTPGDFPADRTTSLRPNRAASAIPTPTPTAGPNSTPVPSNWHYF